MHNTQNIKIDLAGLAIAAMMILSGRVAITANAAELIDFQSQIAPILEAKCVGCHAQTDGEAGFVAENYDALMHGGDSGVAITPGAPSSSRLHLMISGAAEPKMPPPEETQLTEDEIQLIAEWIEQGAAGPKGEQPPRRTLRVPMIAPAKDVMMPITAIASTSDSSLTALARYGEIELLKADGKCELIIHENLGKANALEFSHDGKLILVASGLTGAYGAAQLYDVTKGTLIREFSGHSDILYDATFSPDNTLVATAGYDRKIILWDSASGKQLREFTGHNGAINDLAFSPDGHVLISASSDNTVKVWQVHSGERLDTLSQPEGEVFAAAISPDNQSIVAASDDNRLRVWRFASKSTPQINPLMVTRFVDESPLVNFQFTPDGKYIVVLSQSGNVKVLDTSDWNQVAALDPLDDVAFDLSINPDGTQILLVTMDGRVMVRNFSPQSAIASDLPASLSPIYMDLGEPTELAESELHTASNSTSSKAHEVPRNAIVRGEITERNQVDSYVWDAKAGEVWAIDADPLSDSPIDPIVNILDASGNPVLRTRLQAIRDSYFTFRGKDSIQSDDFRLFNWEEMHLGEYLYASGEVTRLWMYPRGPDSGYLVFPGQGLRWTYFGTSQTTHALGEPAYIVRELPTGQTPASNGLPVFDVYYGNDDDPARQNGKASRVLFMAPQDGNYVVSVADTRKEGGEAYKYRLAIRAAKPSFNAQVQKIDKELLKGTGREFIVRVDRLDGFDGTVEFDLSGLPDGVVANTPLVIEAGQASAVGTVWVPQEMVAWEQAVSPQITAKAVIGGGLVERNVGTIGEFKIADVPSVIPRIESADGVHDGKSNWKLVIRRGETVTAKVVVERKDGFVNEVSFGNEFSGRNTAFGVYVDNIGLNGLLVRTGETEREFFVTADATAAVGERSFFLTAQVDGNVTTRPITIQVLP